MTLLGLEAPIPGDALQLDTSSRILLLTILSVLNLKSKIENEATTNTKFTNGRLEEEKLNCQIAAAAAAAAGNGMECDDLNV